MPDINDTLPGARLDKATGDNVARRHESKTIKVYVRMGASDDERTIAFWIPEGIPAAELLERGATLDGKQAVLSASYDPDMTEAAGRGVAFYSCPDLNDPASGDHRATSLVRVLGECQRSLVKYLKSHGYEVEFA